MSDDFDNDDLSWLEDPDEPEDDDNQDWLPGDTPEPPDRLGFTGELPWRGGGGKSDDDSGDSLDDDLSWLQDEALFSDSDEDASESAEADVDWMSEPAAASASDEADEESEEAETEGDWLDSIDRLPQSAPLPDDALDDIDQLSQSTPLPDFSMGSGEHVDGEEAAGAAESAIPDWLSGDSGSVDREPVDEEPSMDDLVPDWLAEDDEGETATVTDSDEEDLLDAVPDWIAEAGLDEDEEQDLLESVPDWLAGEESAPMLDETGQLNEDWLSGADNLPQSVEDEQTFDEWMAAQQAAERGLDLEESLPPMADLRGDDDDSTPVPGTDELPDWFLGMEEIDTSDAPAWFTEEPDAGGDWAEDDAQPEGSPSDSEMDDFFDSLDVQPMGSGQFDPPLSFEDMFGQDEEEEAGPVDPGQVPDGELLAALGIESAADEEPEWFAEEEEADAEDMGWLEELGEIDEAGLAQPEPDDFFADLEEPAMDDLAPLEPVNEVDELLAGMSYEGVQLPDSGDLLDDDADFDTLFSDPAFSEVEVEPEPPDEDEIQPETPDWLTEAGATVGGLSAAAMLRQRDDRPLDELPDRLKSLRERGQRIDTEEEAEVVDFIAEPSIDTAAMGRAGIAISLSPAQQQHIDLLQQLTAGAEIKAADTTSPYGFEEDPFMLDEDESLPEVLEVPVQPRRSLRQRVRIDRLLIMLLLFVLMALPFVSDLRIGIPPPGEFAAASRQQAVFESIEGLAIGDYVLVAMEYAPTAAGELDSLTAVLLQHLLERQARPVVVSTNPVALLRANNILSDLGAFDSPLLGTIGRDTPLRSNEDYYVTRYLSGSALGVRALGENLRSMLATDLYGQGTGLDLRTMNDFIRIIVIAERPDDLRAWMEQAGPLTRRPILAATGRVGEPLIAPYVGAGLDGLLVGYGDALTYASRLRGPVRAEIFLPTASPTPITPTFTLTPTLVFDTGVVISAQLVNMRSGPAETFPPETQIEPGQPVTILSRNDDGSWLNVSLPDGTSGWVRADLIAMDDVPVPSATSSPTNTPTETLTPTITPTASPLPSGTPPPSETLPPTETPTRTLTPTITATERVLPPSWTPGPAFTATPPQSIAVARVIADSSVNVRSGPGTTFAPVGLAAPGDSFQVLGRNEDGSWVQIDYPNLEAGQEAWVADFLLEIAVEDVAATEDGSAYDPQTLRLLLHIGMGPGAGGNFWQVGTPEATGETLATLEPPQTATDAEPGEAPTNPPLAVPPASAAAATAQAVALVAQAQGEARWSAMNIGLLFIIGVIILGAVVNIARAILRRGR